MSNIKYYALVALCMAPPIAGFCLVNSNPTVRKAAVTALTIDCIIVAGFWLALQAHINSLS